MDPPILFDDNGERYSNCLRLRTNHQSTENIAKATNFIVAPKPIYLNKYKGEKFVKEVIETI